jgi:predicted small secreted protein
LDSTISTKKPSAPYEPSVGTRLLWWFGIYFAAQLPLIFFIPFFWAFPLGLATYILFMFPSIESHPRSHPFAIELVYTLAYTFYLWHLILSLAVRSKRTFVVLMIILIIVVCLNLSSCSDGMAGLGQIKG